jgi:ribosomal protein L37AE/L43A
LPKPKGEKTLKGLAQKFGAPVRKRYSRIVNLQRMHRKCPSCGSWKLRRKASGIWTCLHCDFKIAGEAFDVKT